MMPSLKSFHLKIESHPGQLEFVRDWVLEAQKQIGEKVFHHKALRAVTLSLIEAVNNAIFHAHEGLPEAHIELNLEYAGQTICVEVTDLGPGFSLEKWQALPKTQAEHGRGVYLMRQLMHEVSNSHQHNKHTVRLVYHL